LIGIELLTPSPILFNREMDAAFQILGLGIDFDPIFVE
jgi:hypothetical protein